MKTTTKRKTNRSGKKNNSGSEIRDIGCIPDELRSVEDAPLLCAGVTTYNALRNAGLRAGDLVAIQGIGGLGHLVVQFARKMGFHTVAIGREGAHSRVVLKPHLQ